MVTEDYEARVLYRILESLQEREPLGFGVAYEKQGRVLFFVPGWRGVINLSADSIRELDERHFPSQGSRYRWREMQVWEDDIAFSPLAALKKQASRFSEMREQGMQDETITHEEYERMQDELGLPLRRKSPRKWVVPLLAVICASALVAAALVLFWKLANPPLPPVAPGKPVFIRDIYILIDPTNSMGDDSFAEAKEIITDRIFPNLGPGDRVFCYSIGPDFVEVRNRVFGKKTLPGVPENLLEPRLAERIPAENITALWQQVDDVIRQDWAKELETLPYRVDSQGRYLYASNYLEAISYIEKRIHPPSSQQVRDKWLIVIGDLQQDPIPKRLQPPDQKAGEDKAFQGIEVRLIYTYRSGARRFAQPTELQQFWKEYFEKRGNKAASFTTFDDATPLLPPSPVRRVAAAN